MRGQWVINLRTSLLHNSDNEKVPREVCFLKGEVLYHLTSAFSNSVVVWLDYLVLNNPNLVRLWCRSPQKHNWDRKAAVRILPTNSIECSASSYPDNWPYVKSEHVVCRVLVVHLSSTWRGGRAQCGRSTRAIDRTTVERVCNYAVRSEPLQMLQAFIAILSCKSSILQLDKESKLRVFISTETMTINATIFVWRSSLQSWKTHPILKG